MVIFKMVIPSHMTSSDNVSARTVGMREHGTRKYCDTQNKLKEWKCFSHILIIEANIRILAQLAFFLMLLARQRLHFIYTRYLSIHAAQRLRQDYDFTIKI